MSCRLHNHQQFTVVFQTPFNGEIVSTETMNKLVNFPLFSWEYLLWLWRPLLGGISCVQIFWRIMLYVWLSYAYHNGRIFQDHIHKWNFIQEWKITNVIIPTISVVKPLPNYLKYVQVSCEKNRSHFASTFLRSVFQWASKFFFFSMLPKIGQFLLTDCTHHFYYPWTHTFISKLTQCQQDRQKLVT